MSEYRFLLDTNILSEFVKARPDINVIKKVAAHCGECAMAATTWHEMYFGMEKLDNGIKKEALKDFLLNDVNTEFKILAYTDRTAVLHAELRAASLRKGFPIDFADSQIAAIALENNLTLVTRNTKHFEALSKISGLKIENWFEGDEG